MSRKGAAAALGAAVLFGSTNVVSKIALRDADAFAAAAVTFAASTLVFLPWLPSFRPARRDLPLFATSALVGGALAITAFYQGLERIPASTASLLVPAEMAFTAVLAFVLLRERVRLREAPGLALLAAAALVVAVLPAQAGGARLLGAGLVLLATFGWAVDNVVNTALSARYAVPHLAVARGVLGSSATLLAAWLLGADFGMRWTTLALLVGNGVLGWGLAIVMYYVALRDVGATRAVVVFSTSGLWGAVAAFLVLREPVAWAHAAGLALALSGFALLLRAARDAPAPTR